MALNGEDSKWCGLALSSLNRGEGGLRGVLGNNRLGLKAAAGDDFGVEKGFGNMSTLDCKKIDKR